MEFIYSFRCHHIFYHPIIMHFGNISFTTALVLLISSVVSIQGDILHQITEHQPARDLIAVQTARGPEKLGDHYPIRISSIDDASQIKPEVEGNTRWVYHLCHPGASFINVHFAELGKSCYIVLSAMLVDLDPMVSNELFDSFSLQTLMKVALVSNLFQYKSLAIADRTDTHTTIFDTVVELSDPAEGDRKPYVLRGKGKREMGTFWAHHVNSPCMDITLQCAENKDASMFEIDDYVAGYAENIFSHNTATSESDPTRKLRGGASWSDREKNPFALPNQRDLSVCNADDKKNAVCYNTVEFATEYENARAVARLFINGSGGCTGWVSHIETIPNMKLDCFMQGIASLVLLSTCAHSSWAQTTS
jgi:hypothetical protein